MPTYALGSNGQPKARALLPAQFALASGIAAASFPLGAPAAAGTVLQNQTDLAQIVPGAFGVDQACVMPSGYVASNGDLWYVVNQCGLTNSFFPAAFEKPLFSFEINSAMFPAGSTFQLAFSLALQLLAANTRAQYIVVIETGSLPEDTAPAPVGLNLQNVQWATATPILAQQVILSDCLVSHSFGAAVSLDATGTVFAAQKLAYGIWTGGAPAPASANFAVRSRLIQFDVEDGVQNPRGVVSYALSSAAASITQG